MGEKQGHAPGPWEVRYRFGRLTTVSGRQKFPICDTGTAPMAQANHGREEANARLIAAAPDLLAAVWALVEHFERVDGDEAHKAVIKQATDAIGKATNRPSPTGQDSPANEGEGR